MVTFVLGFYAVVVFGMGKDFLLESILGRFVSVSKTAYIEWQILQDKNHVGAGHCRKPLGCFVSRPFNLHVISKLLNEIVLSLLVERLAVLQTIGHNALKCM